MDFRSIRIENSRQHFEAPHLVNWAVINSRNPPPNFYRRGVACIFQQWSNAPSNLISFLNLIDGYFVGGDESAVSVTSGFVCPPKHIELARQNSSSYYAHDNEPSRPVSNYSRPFGYFIAGFVCVFVGCALAFYTAPYGSNKKYQARQYIIDTVICFGLFIAAVRSLPKGLT